MREIKFRAWDKVKHRMFGIAQLAFDINGELVSIYSNGPDFSNDSEALMGEEPSLNKAVLMEYTGLHDKNGKEIYECDVVRSIPRRQHEKSFVGAVHYGRVDPSFTIHDKDGHDFRLYSSGEYRTYEVIGNIYENPKLLEVTDNEQ